MKTKPTTIVGMLTLGLLLAAGSIDEARAGIKVRANIVTPHVRVRVDNDPYVRHRHVVRDHRYGKHRMRYEVTRRDRRMAKRLSRYTGVPRRVLLRDRRLGYSWREIGRYWDIPRRVIRAASDGRSWKRFLRRDRVHAHHGRRYCNNGFYDD